MEESVRNCYHCGVQTVVPHRCPHCGLYFCDKHRLPKQHNCVSLRRPPQAKKRRRSFRSSFVGRVIIVGGIIAGLLVILHEFGVIDLYEVIGYLRSLIG
ncbi:AN1-type zinc finger domain-containing protein [Candidatus Bathyarchaeota archaeon]|nr:AN1-type zinc finger domain-containing protein [Candidatus Bathyarchaeota archaeon]